MGAAEDAEDAFVRDNMPAGRLTMARRDGVMSVF
jgi:hypothetical protein